MIDIPLSDDEFARLRRMIHEIAGIQLSDSKKVLVSSRLAVRLRARSLDSYADYARLIASQDETDELQMAVNLLTTNETYFFREPKHFEFLRQVLRQEKRSGEPFRVWSAASSSGEEAFSIAMMLADHLGERPWEVFASDLSTRMLASARVGHYPMVRATHIPEDYLRKYCLKGIGPQDGTLLISEVLRERVHFEQVNLTRPLIGVGKFRLVMLRNVMIYFDSDTRRAVVERVVDTILPGGWLMIGHSETLHGISSGLRQMAPSIFQKPGAP